MLIFGELIFLTVYFIHYELENVVMATPKRCSILSFIFTGLCITKPFHAVCPNATTLNQTSGVVTSPFYPRNYLYNKTCSWQITTSEGKRVVLIIEDMKMQQCNASCTCDYLEIQNALPSDAASSWRRCDSCRVAFYSIPRESLKVLFVSDWSGNKQYRGFKATYTQVNYTSVTTGQ